MTDPAPIDLWSPLDRKLTDTNGRTTLRLAPTWVPATETRRLNAYIIRAAYRSNVAYRFMAGDAVKNSKRREYGEPALYEDRMVAAIRGDGQTITIDGADDDLDAFELPPEPPEPDAETAGLQAEVARLKHQRWKDQAEQLVAEFKTAVERQPALQARQHAMRDWADAVSLMGHLEESEHDAVGLADSVIVLWPRPGDWPLPQVYDPGIYFPQIPANGDQTDFPGGLHFAWEFDDTDPEGKTARYVRRITFELVEIASLRANFDGAVPVWVGPDGQPLAPGAQLVLPQSETVDQNGYVHRKLPWHVDGEDTTTTCVVSDMTWPLAAVQAGKSDAFAITNARSVTLDQFDLGVDFLPVIHRPNTRTGREHFGRSLFDLAIRLFDDLALVDTLTMNASNYLGHPTMGARGVSVGENSVAVPGTVIGLGPDGHLDVLDLSAGIEQLMALDDRLQDRVGTNLGLPAEMTGRTSGGESKGEGHHLLKLAPAVAAISALREVREPKDRILLRMGQRMAQVAGALPPGPTPVARIRYGNILPTDLAQTMKVVADGLDSHAISTQTAVNMLVAAGLPIDDARAEVARIQAENTGALSELATALEAAPGVNEVIAEKAGVELPAAPPAAAPPVIDLP